VPGPKTLAASVGQTRIDNRMKEYLYLNNVKREGNNSPTWENITEDTWKIILNDFVFKVADSFGFMKVVSKKDLFPKGLNYFTNWELNEKGLVELETDIIVKFDLNENCKQKLLEYEFARHELGMFPPRNYKEYDELHYYYEFDELYFFSAVRQVFTYIHHESMITFDNLNDKEIKLLNKLDKNILKDIIER
jgi:hypothetical protein